LGFDSPTQIQQAVIPTALLGKDICACAVTGSGKTLSFMIPTVERLIYKPKYPQVTRVLVMTPTRELAAQICKVTRDITQFTQIQTCLCAGKKTEIIILNSNYFIEFINLKKIYFLKVVLISSPKKHR
jgi:ATP-dependent RNA helicase DDX27